MHVLPQVRICIVKNHVRERPCNDGYGVAPLRLSIDYLLPHSLRFLIAIAKAAQVILYLHLSYTYIKGVFDSKEAHGEPYKSSSS